MTRNAVKFLTVLALSATVGQAVLAVPAEAGGRISFDVAPRNQREAAIFSTGIRVYSLFRGVKDGEIRQQGNGNAAGLAQAGRGNVGFIQQQGNGHRATLQQNGDNNAYGIFQYGRNTDDEIVQNGNNRSGATFSFGW